MKSEREKPALARAQAEADQIRAQKNPNTGEVTPKADPDNIFAKTAERNERLKAAIEKVDAHTAESAATTHIDPDTGEIINDDMAARAQEKTAARNEYADAIAQDKRTAALNDALNDPTGEKAAELLAKQLDDRKVMGLL